MSLEEKKENTLTVARKDHNELHARKYFMN